MQRRDLLRAGLSLSALTTAAPLAGATVTRREVEHDDPAAFDPKDWRSVRNQFALDRAHVHMTMFLFASHPRPVAEEIELHRRGFDANPALYLRGKLGEMDWRSRGAAAEYMGGRAEDIALTDSTTMGLGLVYGSLDIADDQEAVCTTHCHDSTQMALEHRSQRTGTKVRQVALYADPAKVTVDEVVANTRSAIGPKTRLFAVTWVHSCTGVKLPIRAMADVVEEINTTRSAKDRVIFCVDGVHGFGTEDQNIGELGCDFFIAGTHKWIFGPRGTAVIWAREGAWELAAPIIPSFGKNGAAWRGKVAQDEVAAGDLMTPGGFHSYEHRWSLPPAFEFHRAIGKDRVQARIHALNSMLKEGLAGMDHVTLHTPLDPALSAGIICFEVDGLEPGQVVERFGEKQIVASTSPYRVSYPRLAPSLLNDETDVEASLVVLASMA